MELVLIGMLVLLAILWLYRSRGGKAAGGGSLDSTGLGREAGGTGMTPARPVAEAPARADQAAPAAAQFRPPGPRGRQPLERADLELETLWRLEQVLRELPDPGEARMLRIDFGMEPREIATIISSNPFYAARIIRLVNSAAFGLSTRIDSLPRAITYLGYNEVKNMVFGHALQRTIGGRFREAAGFDLLAFWKHSHAVSVASEFLLREVLGRTGPLGAVTTAALLHDLGWIVFPCYDRERAALLFERLGSGEPGADQDTIRLEEEAFGFGHPLAGRLLAGKWQFSSETAEMIGRHHCGCYGFGDEPGRLPALGAAVISWAEELAAKAGYPHPLAEPWMVRVELAGVLGPAIGSLREPPLKLREKIEQTIRLIEEFNREE